MSDQRTTGERHPAITSILEHFSYQHLPEDLRLVSKSICEMAYLMAAILPSDPEVTAGLRKLLEAKDCFVRARVASRDKVEVSSPGTP